MNASFITSFATALALSAALPAASTPAAAAPDRESITFPMVVSAGAATCLKDARATVIVSSVGPYENLTVLARGLPPNTDFDLFTIQIPGAPFGVSWYVGDMRSDGFGVAVGDFAGRFSSETFVVSPDVTQPPWIHPGDARVGIKTAPIHTFHLGLWFNSPKDAKNAGCPDAVTPFNGEHDAGIQVLNTSTFPNLRGPLLQLR